MGEATAIGPATHGVWFGKDKIPEDAKEAGAVAATVEALGFGTIWIGGSPTDDLTEIEDLLAGSERLVVGTSIVNVWMQPAGTIAKATQRLNERFPGRFLLGLGNGHAPSTEATGQSYAKPLTKLRSYLEELDGLGVAPSARMIAALGPKALETARDQTAGALPYLTTPEHTAQARAILGAGPRLVPELTVVVEADPTLARQIARKRLATYLVLPNYVNSWRRLGFTDEDFADGGSDHLVDALVAHGPADVVRSRIGDFLRSGADSVAIQALAADGELPVDAWRALSASGS